MNFSTSDAILITKQEAARILGIHHTTLRSLRNKENSGIIEGLHGSNGTHAPFATTAY